MRKKLILLAMAGIAFAMPANSQQCTTPPGCSLPSFTRSEIVCQAPQQETVSAGSEEFPDDTLAYILAIVAIVTSAAASVFLLCERKKNSRLGAVSQDRFAKNENKLADIEQSINAFVTHDEFERKLAELHREISNIERGNANNAQVKNNNNQMPAKQEKLGDKNKKKVDIVYASASMREGVVFLSIVDGTLTAYMPFELHITDTDCQVFFNQSSFSTVMNSMETKILPYVDLQIRNRNHPTSIRTIVPGKATKQGESWILKTKPKLELI